MTGSTWSQPWLLCEGDTAQVITAVRRPGHTHASRWVVAVLTRVVRALRARWPGVTIARRADAGGAVPAIDEFCAQARVVSPLGIIPNPRLDALATPLVVAAPQEPATTGAAGGRLGGEATDQAARWSQPRRISSNAEAVAKGPHTRFGVTTRREAPEPLDTWSVGRGERAGWIKDLQRACFADRLSDHRFAANQVRLLLPAAAAGLLDTVRRWLTPLAVPRLQRDTLRRQLLKIGGRVWHLADRGRLRLASSHPGPLLWYRLAAGRGLRE